MTATVNTPAEFARWANGAGGELVAAAVRARVAARRERERVDAYVGPIFARYGFVNQWTGKPLAVPRDLYLAGGTPEIEERCGAFYKECDAAHRAHGFTGGDGFCPALIAENEVIAAERDLIAGAGGVFGFDPNTCWGGPREKMLDLLYEAALTYSPGGAGVILYAGRTAVWETTTRSDMAAFLKAHKLKARYRPLGIAIF